MAGRGRGRGRGLVITKPTVPGGGDNSEPTVVPTEIEQAPVKKDSRSVQALNDLRSLLTTSVTSHSGDGIMDFAEEDLQRIEQLFTLSADVVESAKAFYSAVKECRHFVKPIAALCERLSNLNSEGTQFRSALLRMVQEDYKDRVRLKDTSKDEFLSCLAMLSHLFVVLRLANGDPMLALIAPLYDCLEMIIMGDTIVDGEAEVFNNALLLIGRELQDHDDERMQNLLISVRTRIIEKKTTPEVRCYLLEVLENYARRWQQAPNDVTRFYMDVVMDIYAENVVDQA